MIILGTRQKSIYTIIKQESRNLILIYRMYLYFERIRISNLLFNRITPENNGKRRGEKGITNEPDMFTARCSHAGYLQR